MRKSDIGTYSPPFQKIAACFADPVQPANFPQSVLRWRNQRAAESVGLGHLTSDAWLRHFARFDPLPGNLMTPLAMRYHGHQFGVYNPDLGDGRGFLFAQLRDRRSRWLDLGTKGSGQTPWSRQGDGRLTLKGGVREILASAYLEALGVNTSKALSLVETGEQLQRTDEPSPTRSSVLVRLSHSHIRFGTFQRCAYFGDADAMAELVHHCAETYFPEVLDVETSRTATALFARIAAQTATMIGQWMAAGFVHGVMNTDNFNITGETFDFGPWRFLPVSDPNFTAAYFDHSGLYRFGRQPVQGAWALQQLARALTLLSSPEALTEALQHYEETYRQSLIAHTHALLGLAPIGVEAADVEFLAGLYRWMTESAACWPQVFFDWFCGAESLARAAASPQANLYAATEFAPVRRAILERTSVRPERLAAGYFAANRPVTMLYDDVEALWAPIAEEDDWQAFHRMTAHIEQAREALALCPGGMA